MTALPISSAQISEMTPHIGELIDVRFNNPEATTPTQQNKIAAIAISALAAVAGVFCAIASFGTSSIILPLLTIILLAGSALGTYYIATVKDYDSPQERQTYIDAIAREFLTDIAKEHSTQKVIGYRLLGENVEVYVAFQQLAEDFQTARTNLNAQTDRIQAGYDHQMGPARTRVALAVQGAELHQQSHYMTQSPNPSTLRSVGNAIQTVADTANTVSAVQSMRTAARAYQPDRDASLTAARTTFDERCRHINTQFETFRQRLTT